MVAGVHEDYQKHGYVRAECMSDEGEHEFKLKTDMVLHVCAIDPSIILVLQTLNK